MNTPETESGACIVPASRPQTWGTSLPDLAAPCQACHRAEATTPAGCCLPCALEIAHDAHDRALFAHAVMGGSYDTRPVFIHPSRRITSAEYEDARRRLAAWQAWLKTNPEGRIR